MTNRTLVYLRYFLFLLYIVHGLFIINGNSVTNDEMDHWSYGKRMLMLRPEKIYPYDDASTMPISGINAVPRAIQQMIHPTLEKDDGGTSDIMNGRYVTLFICLLIGFYIYKWSREMFDERAAIFSLFLFVFCPNLNANTALLNTDAYSALFTLTTAYYFYCFVKFSGWRNFLLFCISLGLSQVVKQSLVLLPVFFGLASVVLLARRKTLFSRWKINLMRLAILSIIILFIINAAFFFRGSGNSLNEYTFYSDYFKNLSHSIIGNIPVPLPAPFIEGYDLVKYMLGLGSGHENVSSRSYLLGNYFTGGKWYYYPVVLFLKTPLLVLLLSVYLIYLLIRGKVNRIKTVFPLALTLFFLLVFVFFNSSQHSIRHLIMIFPLIYVAMGQLINTSIIRRKWILGITVIYSLTTFYFYFPNLISYTNELVLPKRNAYKYLASSNIDYGQCKNCFTKYPVKHPEITLPGEVPSEGNFIIGINYYLDLQGDGKYVWLQQFKPYAHVNHCLLLIRVTDEDLTRMKKSTVE